MNRLGNAIEFIDQKPWRFASVLIAYAVIFTATVIFAAFA